MKIWYNILQMDKSVGHTPHERRECGKGEKAASISSEPPAWHEDVLATRRRRVAAGEEGFMSIAESMRRLYEEVASRKDFRI